MSLPEIAAAPEFVGFPKLARLSRECLITEKIDGTNAQLFITNDGGLFVGSRTRWVTPESDNHGFARWASQHRDELLGLGPGRHFGEWWGSGIQRGYGLPKGEKRFSLFNVQRWSLEPQGDQQRPPECCQVVPILYRGPFTTKAVDHYLLMLALEGSHAAPGFMRPEGVVVFHVAGNVGFKKTLEGDEVPKSQNNRNEPCSRTILTSLSAAAA